MWWLTLANPASACEPYPNAALLDDVTALEAELRDGKSPREHALAVTDRLPCLEQTVSAPVLARTYRDIGASLFPSADAGRWLATSKALDGSFTFARGDVSASVMVAWDAAAPGDPVRVAGRAFGPGRHYLDGKPLKEPKALPGVPHLYQWDAAGQVRTWLIEGSAFPDGVLVTPAGALSRPGRTFGESAASDVRMDALRADAPPAPAPPRSTGTKAIIAEPERPPEKTPLLVGGIAGLLGSAALYGIAASERSRFDAAPDQDTMDSARASTNRLTIASGATLLVGGGVLGYSLTLPDGPKRKVSK